MSTTPHHGDVASSAPLRSPRGLEERSECTGEVCTTCSDEGRVVEVRRLIDYHRAEVVSGDRTEIVDVSLVDPVGQGDRLLVHAGVAVATLEQ